VKSLARFSPLLRKAASVMRYFKKNYKMRKLIFLLFIISLIIGCKKKEESAIKIGGETDCFLSNYISKILHDCKKYYGGPKNSWDCCCEDIDVIKGFSKDTIQSLINFNRIADTLISDADVYDLLNQTVFSGKEKYFQNKKLVILQQETFTHFENFNLNTLSSDTDIIDKKDVLFLMSQLTCKSYFWDNSKLKNVKCISTQEMKNFFNIPANIPKWKIAGIIQNHQKKFKSKYGQEYPVRYSRPIFNKEKNLAIMQLDTRNNGTLVIFKKINNCWKIIKNEELWIS
jgi:hypothetical protein